MSEFTENEKTTFKPRQQHNHNDEKTRIAPALSAHSAGAKKSLVEPDFEHSGVLDKTKIVPTGARGEDATRIAPSMKKTDRSSVSAVDAQTLLASDSGFSILKKRFILEELLGAGGMGVVYKAKDLLKIEAQDRDPYVAIKVLTDEFKSHPEAFIALQRESRKTQRIAHPNIVTVFDFDRDGDTVFMTMEYLDGKPLDKLIAQYRSIGLPAQEVEKIVEGISSALIYAHQQNIIHSDFKPGNIFVSNNGVAKVIDFGIARAVAKVEQREDSVDDKTVFDAGNLGALTPAYASLEMLEGKTPDVRDDIYALGCITYELFTGNHPFNRVHADEAKRQKLKPKKIPGISKGQWKAIEKSLAFDRADRTQSVQEFLETFTQKVNPKRWLVSFLIVLLTIGIGLYVRHSIEPVQTFSEHDVRNEIETKLRIEMNQKALAELIALKSFTSDWENQVWGLVQDHRKLVSQSDAWLIDAEAQVFSLYLEQIRTAFANDELSSIAQWIEHAPRYGNNEALLDGYRTQLADAIKAKEARTKTMETERARQLAEQQRLKAEQEAEQQRESVKKAALAQDLNEFNTALANVNKQLSCQASIDIKDFQIAIVKLRTLNNQAYIKQEPNIVSDLVACIQKIGLAFPDHAELIKRQALRIFPSNAALGAIKIAPKDPCSLSLAGLGGRGIGSACRDRLPGAARAPYLVVVPARGSIKAFAIGKFEVSEEEFADFCREQNSCASAPVANGLPVTNVSAQQVSDYLKWLSAKSGYEYRLPTQTEWLYAAKATSATPDPNRNCKLNSRGIQKGGVLNKATLGQQNAWGLVNHLGNARELVMGSGATHLALGGSYETEMAECTFDNSLVFDGGADKLTGFRVARELKQ